MLGMPAAVCPPHDSDLRNRGYGSGVQIGAHDTTSPFLKKIDDLFDWVIRLPETITKLNKPVKKQIVLTDRMNLAQNQSISREEMELLSKDPNPLVRIELAWNESIPEGVLIQLLKDRNSSVSNIAKVRLKSLLKLAF